MNVASAATNTAGITSQVGVFRCANTLVSSSLTSYTAKGLGICLLFCKLFIFVDYGPLMGFLYLDGTVSTSKTLKAGNKD